MVSDIVTTMPPSRGVKKPKEDKSNNRVLANRYRLVQGVQNKQAKYWQVVSDIVITMPPSRGVKKPKEDKSDNKVLAR